MVIGPDVAMDERRLREQTDRLRQLVASGEPKELRSSYLMTPRHEYPFLVGTAVPAVGRFAALPSGLLVPQSAAQGPSPIDLTAVYLIASEVLGFVPSMAWVEETLSRLPLDYVLGFLGQIMVRLQKPGRSFHDADLEAADIWFVPTVATKIKNLLAAGQRLLFPQGVLVLAKLAVRHCISNTGPVGDEGVLIPALLLTVAEHLSSPAGDEEERRRQLECEIVANQYFNAPRDPAHLLARFVRRWIQIPREVADVNERVDLEALYADVVGLPLRDVSIVALGLWAAAEPGHTQFAPSHFDTLGWEPERLEAVWQLLSADRDTLLDALNQEADELDGAGEKWGFSAFERYPLLRLENNSVIVLSPDLLLRRVFGWLPFFDVRSGLRTSGNRKGAAQFESTFRKLTEFHGLEILNSIASTGGQRLYSEQQLMSAYAAKGVKLADSAMDYGDAWVVVEISTHQLTRNTAAGVSYEALGHDLDTIVEKAKQLDSTIAQLRSHEERLTGEPKPLSKRFYPVLVPTEGFPINPITLKKLWERVRNAEMLLGEDVAPLQVVDFVELEIVEAVQEAGGPSLRALLANKPNAGLSNASLRDYIVVERHLQPGRSARVERLWLEPFNDVLRALGAAESLDR